MADKPQKKEEMVNKKEEIQYWRVARRVLNVVVKGDPRVPVSNRHRGSQ